MIGTRLVYAQQDSSNRTNDLIITNDTDQYSNAGLTIGDGSSSNIRMSYNKTESKGHIKTNTLSIDAPEIFLPNIQPSSTTQNTYNYVVMDNDGNLKQGFGHYNGDITSAISTITKNIAKAEASIQSLSNQVTELDITTSTSSDTSMIWIYILAGFFVFVIIIFIIVQWISNNKQNETISILQKLQKQIRSIKGGVMSISTDIGTSDILGESSGSDILGNVGSSDILGTNIGSSDILGTNVGSTTLGVDLLGTSGTDILGTSGTDISTNSSVSDSDILSSLGKKIGKKNLIEYISKQVL
jgi:hypothetical protein